MQVMESIVKDVIFQNIEPTEELSNRIIDLSVHMDKFNVAVEWVN